MSTTKDNAKQLKEVVKVTPAPQQAMNFILDSWKKSAMSLPVYEWITDFRSVNTHIERIVQTADILVATAAHTPDTYAGWVCYGRRCLYYVYVKASLRKIGLATLLLQAAALDDNISTPFYKKFLYDHWDLVYKPEILKQVVL
jgi:hypothetical protein